MGGTTCYQAFVLSDTTADIVLWEIESLFITMEEVEWSGSLPCPLCCTNRHFGIFFYTTTSDYIVLKCDFHDKQLGGRRCSGRSKGNLIRQSEPLGHINIL